MNTKNVFSSVKRENNLGDGYLQFYLHQHAAILSIKYIQEVMVAPVDSVTVMPSIPEYFLGLINHRDRVIWLIDLPKILDVQSEINQFGQYNIIIVRTNTAILGLVVPKIKGTTKFVSEDIQPRSQINGVSNLSSYFQGYAMQDRELLLVLDIDVLLKTLGFDS